MKRLFNKTLLLSAFVFVATNTEAQDKPPAKETPLLTEASLVSGNNKDILTNFFQLALDNLLGNNKELNFNTNPYAVMVKNNSRLKTDHYYSKYKSLRKLNFGVGLRLDTSFRFNGFSSGVKYALINDRDHTTSKFFADNLRFSGFAEEQTILNIELVKMDKERFDRSAHTAADTAAHLKFLDNIRTLFNKKKPFNTLPADFRTDVMAMVNKQELDEIAAFIIAHPDSSLRSFDEATFNQLKEQIKTATLWTVGISDTTYRNQFAFSNVVIHSEFSKGLFKPKSGANNVELNISAAGNLLRDTLRAGNNLKRFVFDIEAGLNWVIRDKQNDRSMFEFKASGSYYHNFTSLYAGEDRAGMTLNGTLRVRIYEDIWVPVEFKYDPGNGNVFGFLNVKANFTGLKKMLAAAK